MPAAPLRLAGILGLLLAAAGPAAAATDPARADADETARICDQVAAEAAAETGVPLDVLRAITRTETGRVRGGALRPWPWTVNMEGQGFWFETAEEAVAFAEARRAAGARSFDMGCFQVNYRWHGTHFASLAEMMDPRANARYAARFLASLHAALGDWTLAAGRYHSATPELAVRYRTRFARILAALPPAEAAPGPLLAALTPPRETPRPAAPRPAPVYVALPPTPGAVQILHPAASPLLRAPAGPLLAPPAPVAVSPPA